MRMPIRLSIFDKRTAVDAEKESWQSSVNRRNTSKIMSKGTLCIVRWPYSHDNNDKVSLLLIGSTVVSKVLRSSYSTVRLVAQQHLSLRNQRGHKMRRCNTTVLLPLVPLAGERVFIPNGSNKRCLAVEEQTVVVVPVRCSISRAWRTSP